MWGDFENMKMGPVECFGEKHVTYGMVQGGTGRSEVG